MIEIVLLIIGIVYAVRRPKLRRLTSGDYVDIDPARFSEWHNAQLRATDIFLWATWGAFVIKMLVIFIAVSGGGFNADIAGAIQVAIVVGWLAALTTAAVFGSKAKKLRLAAGIQWPKKA
ncbi:MAG: hypothetical protein PHF56_24335 [Desulfuromonadaceae bacterium]|nr:hypothetical protein [Desulfuromonadaceae bacterium]